MHYGSFFMEKYMFTEIVTFDEAYFGRKVLKYADTTNLTYTKVAEILDSGIFRMHLENADDINDLYWFYRGNQPILNRVKEIRPEIANKVVENRAFEVVEFKKGYEFSHPIQYTNVGSKETARIDALNTFARLDGKETKDLQLGEWEFIAGLGFRIVLPKKNHTVDESPYYTQALDPRNTFVVYASGVEGRQLFSCSYSEETKNIVDKKYRVGIYTDNWYYEWELDSLHSSFTSLKPVRVEPNPLRMNPIIEYPLNSSRIGYVDLCFSLQNAINNANSNRLDGIEQFIQQIIWFNNCTIDEEKMKQLESKNGGVIMTKDAGTNKASVQYLVQQLNQGDVQITKEDLLSALYEVCGVPNRQQTNAGGDTGQAVLLRNGWGSAETRAKSTEKMFAKSENEYLKRVLNIVRRLEPESIGDLTLGDIGVNFTRNRSDNMQVKAQSLQMLLSAGIHPEDAYEISELFSDPNASYIKAQAWAKEQEAKLEAERVKLLDEQMKLKELENKAPQGDLDNNQNENESGNATSEVE